MTSRETLEELISQAAEENGIACQRPEVTRDFARIWRSWAKTVRSLIRWWAGARMSPSDADWLTEELSRRDAPFVAWMTIAGYEGVEVAKDHHDWDLYLTDDFVLGSLIEHFKRYLAHWHLHIETALVEAAHACADKDANVVFVSRGRWRRR